MKKSGESTLFVIMGLIVLLGGGALFGLQALQNRPDTPTPAQPTPQPTVTDADFNRLTKDARHVIEKPGAQATVVEFADFQCPSCRRAFNGEKDEGGPVKAIEEKPIRYIFRHLPLLEMHERAMPAAVASEAAARQGKFWPMYNALFQNTKVELTEEFFDQCAKKAGLDMDKFHKDQADPKLQDLILADKKLATEVQVDSTPTFFVQDAQGKLHRVVGGIELTKLMTELKL